MSWRDNKNIIDDILYTNRNHVFSAQISKDEAHEYLQRLRDILSSSTSNITSRDQIINPMDYLDFNMYRNSAKGQAFYNEHLTALENLSLAQEASYKEWYDSEQQQAKRQRDAGLNPDLIGVDPGASAQAGLSEGSPIANTPTSGQIITNFAGSVAQLASIASSVGNLIAIPSQISAASATASAATAAANLSKAQTDAVNLDSMSKFESLVYGSASSKLADAMSSAASAGEVFNFDDWFNNSSNFDGIFESYAPSDTPQYRAAYGRAISNVQKLKSSAFQLANESATQQGNFAKALSNPYFDEDLLLQVGLMEPVMKAFEDLRLLQKDYDTKLLELKSKVVEGVDASSASSAINAESSSKVAKFNYETDYFNGFDGDEVALAEFKMKQAQSIVSTLQAKIDSNLFEVYNKKPNSFTGLRAANMILGGAGMAYKDYLLSFALTDGFSNKDNISNSDMSNIQFPDASQWLKDNAQFMVD